MESDQNSEQQADSLFQKYKAELMDDVKLDLSNIHEKSLLASSIRAKWLNYFFNEKSNLEKIKLAKQKIMEASLKSLKQSPSLIQLKSEDIASKNDSRIAKLNSMMDMTKQNVSYIEYAMNILNDFGFQIKNCIELCKLEKS